MEFRRRDLERGEWGSARACSSPDLLIFGLRVGTSAPTRPSDFHYVELVVGFLVPQASAVLVVCHSLRFRMLPSLFQLTNSNDIGPAPKVGGANVFIVE